MHILYRNRKSYQVVFIFIMLNEEEAEKQNKIAEIQESKFLSEPEKIQRVSEVKNSKISQTDSSLKTVVSLANTMVGSAIIVYPILFVKDGMISSAIVLFTVGFVNYLTCRLLVVHNRNDEPGFNDSIMRIGGISLSRINNAANVCLFFFVCIAYFLLIASNFFQITVAIIKTFKNFDPPKTTVITFDQYSIQWASIICLAFCSPIALKKQIQLILKLFKISIYFICSFGVFVIVSIVRELIEGKIDFSQFVKFDSDFSSVAGTFALSFLIHPVASPILKKNVNLNNNSRDLLFGYILTGFIYFFVGFFGGLTCASEVNNIYAHPEQYTTIFDCVKATETTEDKVFYGFGKLIQFGILYQNFTVLPILIFLTRKQFLTLFKNINKNFLHYSFTLVWIVLAGFIAILSIDVSVILSFNGAIVGFFIIYGIPIYMHLKCYHHKYTAQEDSRRRSLLMSTESETNGMQIQSEISEQMLRCNQHPKKSKLKHFAFYSVIILFGIALGTFKILSFVQK